jgi:osmotically-inducible protein OsmY
MNRRYDNVRGSNSEGRSDRDQREHEAAAFRERARYEMSTSGLPSLWDRVKGVFTGRGPKNYVRPDERIREDVCEQLADHAYVDASEIEVFVTNGEVTLKGSVDARLVKRAAEDCADHVRGVKDVHNQLRVKSPAAPMR